MAGNIIPIKLNVTAGELTTLWAPSWREGDEDWEGFIGDDEKIFAFKEVSSLINYAKKDKKNSLIDHPYWDDLVKSELISFVPKPENEYDLIGIFEQFAEDPTPESVEKVEKVFDITRTIGEVLDLTSVNKLFNGNLILSVVSSQNTEIYSKEGKKFWKKIAKVINKNWMNIVDEIDSVIKTPKTTTAEDKKIKALLDTEIEKQNTLDKEIKKLEESFVEDVNSKKEAEYYLTEDIDTNSPWYKAGIDPISINLGNDKYFTLRCYLDENPIFLGNKKKIYVFDSEELLLDFIAKDEKSSMANVNTYDELKIALKNSKQSIDILRENKYDLNGIEKDIKAGPLRIDQEQLANASELLEDAGKYVENKDFLISISTSTPLGWLINSVISDIEQKIKPQPPFDTESEEWQVALFEFSKFLMQNP